MPAKVVMTTGAFDILHPGHVKLLEEAKRIGGKNSKLIVVVARNRTVERHKGRKPVFDEKARRTIIEALKPVDKAVLGYQPFSFERVIKKYRPDVIVFGYDQRWLMERFAEVCKKKGWKIKLRVAKKYRVGRLDSSSDVIHAIKRLAAGARRGQGRRRPATKGKA